MENVLSPIIEKILGVSGQGGYLVKYKGSSYLNPGLISVDKLSKGSPIFKRFMKLKEPIRVSKYQQVEYLVRSNDRFKYIHQN